MNQHFPHRGAAAYRHHGFTLVEVMVVVAIIGILAAIAYPSYTRYVIDTRRATGAGCLMELSQWMERNYTTCLRYDRIDSPGGTQCETTVDSNQLPALQCRTDLGTAYTFTVSGAPPITTNTYRLDATPGGAQASDTECGTLSINQLGVKSVSGTTAATACWQ